MSLTATPTKHGLKSTFKFETIAAALDYAAGGGTGFNYYNGRGKLTDTLPYRDLRRKARHAARQLQNLGLARGARVALVADTNSTFPIFFFACQYAGLVPVPVPPPLQLGGANQYVTTLRGMLKSADARACIGPGETVDLTADAAEDMDLKFVGSPTTFEQFPALDRPLNPLRSSELAYLQYTSGSTRFPRGVKITQNALMSNLAGTIEHLEVCADDRAVSWLPYYHDMGLVGLVLAPLACQMSVDYIGSREFAMRPRQWLSRLSEAKATISFGPPFGYELCARRLRSDDVAKLDLSHWRIAGVGAESIRVDTLARFAETLAPTGFNSRAFLSCYGLAESTLAVSFTSLNCGIESETLTSGTRDPAPTTKTLQIPHIDHQRIATIANCGKPLTGHEIEVRDARGTKLAERNNGHVFIRGPSIMTGYIEDGDAPSDRIDANGWLDTGDVGYISNGDLYISGRRKDMLIIHGRNIWPQDIEHIVEQFDTVRTGDASAFAITGLDGADEAVVVVQYRDRSSNTLKVLETKIKKTISAELGIKCTVDFVPLHTLVRTSSGKLSRYRVREDYLDRARVMRPAALKEAG